MLDVPNQKTLPYWFIALLVSVVGFLFARLEGKDNYWREIIKNERVEFDKERARCQAKSDSLYAQIMTEKRDLANFRAEQANTYRQYYETIAKLKKKQ